MRPRFSFVVVAIAGVFAPLACKSATEITLDVRTNADCSNPATWKGVAIYSGTPGDDVESKAPTLTTIECHGGEVGTLTIVPSGAKDAEVGLRVVAGLGRKPEDCRASGYAGCIVARRTIRFEAGQSVAVVVDLTTDCTGLGCDALHTCVNGSCLDSHQSTVDSPDAAPSGPMVRCGDNAVQCPTTGDVCCLTINADGTTHGECKDVKACPAQNPVLYCDDDSDCRSVPGDDGGTAVCCLAGAGGYCNFGGQRSTGAQCVPPSRCNGDTVLCEERKPCGGGALCQASGVMPGYHDCCFFTGP